MKNEPTDADKVQPAAAEENDEEPAGDESGDDGEEEDDEEEPEGPLTAVESTCMLADMVSKLTLIHETTSRPLPFVDASLSQKFFNDTQTAKDSAVTDDGDSIRTLEQCFQRYFKPETLTAENRFDCYYCRSLDRTQSKTSDHSSRSHHACDLEKVLTEATRQAVFFQMPPILPLFLKRFQMVRLSTDRPTDCRAHSRPPF